MKVASAVVALASLATTALAGGPISGYSHPHGTCLSQSYAETLVGRYRNVVAQVPCDIGGPYKCARAITASNYTEESDSANLQIGLPLGGLTAASKADFVQQSQNNPAVQIDTIGIFVSNCNKITWQWNQPNFGSGQYEIKGFHLFDVNARGRIEKAYFEFNSVAGQLDLGFKIYWPNGTVFPTPQ